MNAEKQKFRQYFLKCKPYIRFAPILEKYNIPKVNFSQYLNGSNMNAMSIERLAIVKKEIQKIMKEIVEK